MCKPIRNVGSSRACFSCHWAGATHVVQLGPVWIEQRGCEGRHRRAVTLTTRPRGGGANNTLETYESENVRICEPLCGRGLPSTLTGCFLHHMPVKLVRWGDCSILPRLVQLTFSSSWIRLWLATPSQGLEGCGNRARGLERASLAQPCASSRSGEALAARATKLKH